MFVDAPSMRQGFFLLLRVNVELVDLDQIKTGLDTIDVPGFDYPSGYSRPIGSAD